MNISSKCNMVLQTWGKLWVYFFFCLYDFPFIILSPLMCDFLLSLSLPYFPLTSKRDFQDGGLISLKFSVAHHPTQVDLIC